MAESTHIPDRASPVHARPLGANVVCPHCWRNFVASETWAISKSGVDRVVSDPGEGGLRFLPSRFALNGNPYDPSGRECTEFACPDCHLRLERAHLVTEPVFTSVVGAPRAGKTFLLTAAVWQLRSTLQALGCAFEHASPRENGVLQEYGKRLIQPANSDAIIEELGPTDALRPPNGMTVRIKGSDRRLLQPFQYHFLPSPMLTKAGIAKRLLVLYDNPGQDYLSETRDGLESSQHIKHSKVILFVLNPLAERRLRDQCDPNHPLVRNPPEEELRLDGRQELVLSEVIKRATALRGLNPGGKIGARIVVAITKSDLWPKMYNIIRDRQYIVGDPKSPSLARGVIEDVSREARDVMKSVWPEFVKTVETADEENRPKFFPVSILNPDMAQSSVDASGRFAIRGSSVKLNWAEAPMLWWLTRDAGLRGPSRGAPAGGDRPQTPSGPR